MGASAIKGDKPIVEKSRIVRVEVVFEGIDGRSRDDVFHRHASDRGQRDQRSLNLRRSGIEREWARDLSLERESERAPKRMHTVDASSGTTRAQSDITGGER